MDSVIGILGGLFTVICSILATVVTLQKIGLMAGRERNPHLTKTLEKVSNGMDALIDRVEVVDARVTLANGEIKVLRQQHGEPAPQGEYESWKVTPMLTAGVEQAAKASTVNSKMLNALCAAAKSAPDDSKEKAGALWALNEAMKAYDGLKQESGG